MAKKLTVIETEHLPKPVPNDFFSASFSTVAGTPGAPKPPNGFSGSVETFVTEPMNHIIADLTKLLKKDPAALVFVNCFVMTHPILFNVLSNLNTLAVIQKASPTQDLLKRYLRLRCQIRRGDIPGGIFPHLVRRDGQDDYGVAEGFRWLGDQHQTQRWLQNEGRPFNHTKLLGAYTHGDSDMLVPAFAWFGSANHSGNAEKSFEMVHKTTDADYIRKLFDVFGYYWSLSEGLYNYSQGLTPTYTWLKKAGKFSALPECKECESNEKWTPVWVDSEDTNSGPHRVLRCDCGNVMPFLKEHQPVVR